MENSNAKYQALLRLEEKILSLKNVKIENASFFSDFMEDFNKEEERLERIRVVLIELETAFISWFHETAERWVDYSTTSKAREDAKRILEKFIYVINNNQ